ncbi:MAG TPA: TatD family hydrolase [Pyrinomonadaceae bacterium]
MFVDSHAHIDGQEFDADREKVIERARAAGVSIILNVGTGDPHSGALERAVKLGARHENIYTAIGTHPHDARLYDDTAEERIETLLTSEHVIAWGEIGLDFHYDNSPRDVQVAVFKRQLNAARECDLPVVIHTREAESETIEILKSDYAEAKHRGVFHCFSGSMDLAQRAIELGFMISFSGIVTFKKADELRAVVKEVPLDRLLIETDCPYLTPIPYRGKRNEPAYVVEVARCLAGLHGVDLEEMARITTENFQRFFLH